MIYFDENKNAFAYEIPDYIASVEDEIWTYYASTDKWDIIDGKFTDISDTEEYKEEQAQKERERISMLNLTAADVERGLYKALGKDFDDIIAMASQVQGFDVKALKIELKANNFYRGNPYVSQMGLMLGLTEKQLDEFFETNDYTKLIAD